MLVAHSFEVLLPARVVASFYITNPLCLVAARLTSGADPAREGKEKMSETPETVNTEPTAQTEEQTVETPAQETDWQAEARKWEKRAKENKSAADKLAEIEESKKTEIQKAAEYL